MAEPLVCAVMLTKDRPELAKKAIEYWRAQSYESKILLIWNTGQADLDYSLGRFESIFDPLPDRHVITPKLIGELRNDALGWAVGGLYPPPEIFCHWDDDDYSHPNRIAEQVALLQESGADVVGYNEMLFWRQDLVIPWGMVNCECGNRYPRSGAPCPQCHKYPDGEAWLYYNRSNTYALGTSLMYWWKTWEQRPFQDLPKHPQGTGEDTEFIRGRNIRVCSSIVYDKDPRMIARIHGANTANYDLEKIQAQGSTEWTHLPVWDKWVREILA
jgi:hypothetical protein